MPKLIYADVETHFDYKIKDETISSLCAPICGTTQIFVANFIQTNQREVNCNAAKFIHTYKINTQDMV